MASGNMSESAKLQRKEVRERVWIAEGVKEIGDK